MQGGLLLFALVSETNTQAASEALLAQFRRSMGKLLGTLVYGLK